MSATTTPLLLRDRLAGEVVVEVGFTATALDVSDHAADDVRRVALEAVAHETGARPVVMHQVHGADVVLVDDAAGEVPHCDALATSRAGVALLARAADCVPVLLADARTGWIAAVHAGRPGLASGVVTEAARVLAEAGAAPTTAWLGPHVCGSCYEVPQEMQDAVVAQVPEARATTSWGTPSLDLAAGVRAQLAAAGVADVREVGVCTREDPHWPSFRRDGAAATRFAGVIWRHA